MSCVNEIANCVTQGDSWELDITVTDTGAVDTSGNPVDPKDLTGATFDFTFKESIDGAIIETPAQDLTDLATGRVSFSLTAAETDALITTEDSRVLIGEPQVTYTDGTKDTLFRITLTVHKSWN